MIITTSNILLGLSPTVTAGASTDLPGNTTDPDFSTIYRSSDQLRLTLEFGVTESINYIAVAGHNLANSGDGTARVRVYDDQTLIKTNNIIRNNVVVIEFPEQSFTNLRIGLRNDDGASNPILTFCAAGSAFTVPNNGEEAGYNRQFLNRSIKNKTTTNSIAAPVSVLKKRVPAKGTLKKPNLTKDFTETTWQTFLDFAVDNYFFIQEQQPEVVSEFSGLNSSAYLCYNLTRNSVTTHPQTGALNNTSISFSVYNGL